MNVPKLGLAAGGGFVVVLLLGAFLDAVGQDTRDWWLLLLPIWIAFTYLAYRKWPWKWPPDPPPRVP